MTWLGITVIAIMLAGVAMFVTAPHGREDDDGFHLTDEDGNDL